MPAMLPKLVLVTVASLAALADAPATAAPTVQTLAFIRHGEKPEAGLGQLSCRGLNRALRLPGVISSAVGKPDAIFAPNPAKLKEDAGERYAYVRPLATVEPTAIALGLPVDTRFGYRQIEGLGAALERKAHHGSTILIGWEHKQIEKLAGRLLAAHGGEKAQVPPWRGDDFDSIYIVRITRDGGQSSASFELKGQGLNGQPDRCP